MDSGKAAVIGASIAAATAVIVAVIGAASGTIHFGRTNPTLRFPVAVLENSTGNSGVPNAQEKMPTGHPAR
jgi:hypothetical protein